MCNYYFNFKDFFFSMAPICCLIEKTLASWLAWFKRLITSFIQEDI